MSLIKKENNVKYSQLNEEEFGLHQYSSYEEYKKLQNEMNLTKIKKGVGCWESEKSFFQLSKAIKASIDGEIRFGICHGTRRGQEQALFSKFLDTCVIGTEIADTANEYPLTIQWDFHDIKEEWLGSIDFIYSNSLDHSYDPIFCLSQWSKCITGDGLIILAHGDKGHGSLEYKDKYDPFIGSHETYEKIISQSDLRIVEKTRKYSTNDGTTHFILRRQGE